MRVLRVEGRRHLVDPLEVFAARTVRDEESDRLARVAMHPVRFGGAYVDSGQGFHRKTPSADFDLAIAVGHKQNRMASVRRDNGRTAARDFAVELRLKQ